MRIITLGTGAGRPTLQRSASSMGLEFLGHTFLFDCGENTQLQLMKVPFRWGKLTAIFITHLHGDHVNGLPGLLGTLSLTDREAPLKVFGPPGIQPFLQACFDWQKMGLRYPLDIIEIKKPGMILESKKYQVESKPLEHNIECWGYVFHEKDRPGQFDEAKAEELGIPVGPLRAKLVSGEAIQLENGKPIEPSDVVGPKRSGRSVAYCLDTKFGKKSVALARGVDCLVHEATFDHTQQGDAHLWGHSTAADAARTAKEAKVGELILTHISSRCMGGEVLLKEAKQVFSNTKIARDLQEFEVKKY